MSTSPSAVRPLHSQVSTHAATTAGGRSAAGRATGWPTGRSACGLAGALAGGAGRAAGGAGTASGPPSNHERDGCNHSITADAATTEDTNPPVTMPVRKSGTASTVSASRALRLRRSTW